MAGDRPPLRVLTDTHSLVWALSDPASLNPAARKMLANSEVTASVANLWELCLKAQKKDALLTDPIPVEQIRRQPLNSCSAESGNSRDGTGSTGRY